MERRKMSSTASVNRKCFAARGKPIARSRGDDALAPRMTV
jgi:hypothetical protein